MMNHVDNVRDQVSYSSRELRTLFLAEKERTLYISTHAILKQNKTVWWRQLCLVERRYYQEQYYHGFVVYSEELNCVVIMQLVKQELDNEKIWLKISHLFSQYSSSRGQFYLYIILNDISQQQKQIFDQCNNITFVYYQSVSTIQKNTFCA